MSRFSKLERLNSKKDIENLFRGKNNFIDQNIKVYWDVKESEERSIEVMISVPKKIVPKAYKRNKIKRYLRESYRLNKSILGNLSEDRVIICFMYLSSSLEYLDFKSMEEKIKLILYRLKKEIL